MDFKQEGTERTEKKSSQNYGILTDCSAVGASEPTTPSPQPAPLGRGSEVLGCGEIRAALENLNVASPTDERSLRIGAASPAPAAILETGSLFDVGLRLLPSATAKTDPPKRELQSQTAVIPVKEAVPIPAQPVEIRLEVKAASLGEVEGTEGKRRISESRPLTPPLSPGGVAGETHKPEDMGICLSPSAAKKTETLKRELQTRNAARGDARPTGESEEGEDTLKRELQTKTTVLAGLVAMVNPLAYLPGRGARGARRGSKPPPAQVQAELSLENVKVKRNDLSDADLEVVVARPVVTTGQGGEISKLSAEPTNRAPLPQPATPMMEREKSGEATGLSRLTSRFFGQGETQVR